jgi:hypothetical protein
MHAHHHDGMHCRDMNSKIFNQQLNICEAAQFLHYETAIWQRCYSSLQDIQTTGYQFQEL